jgi:hypothetical protein
MLGSQHPGDLDEHGGDTGKHANDEGVIEIVHTRLLSGGQKC